MTNNKVVTIRFVYHLKKKKLEPEKIRPFMSFYLSLYDRMLFQVLFIKLTFFMMVAVVADRFFFAFF